MGKENKFNFFISLLNFTLLSLYLFFFDLPDKSILFDIILVITILSFVTLILIKFGNSFTKFLNSFQLSLFSIILIFILFEILFIINPKIFPEDLKIWIDKEKGNKETVEYLNESPYVKFKANSKIRIRFYRGTVNQFQYSWITDKRGFKNLNSVADLPRVDIVAVGNSFTEGMGVATEHTYPSILSSNGYSTYNLGVQGYSPSQMAGALQQFGLSLKPKYIIAAYTGGTHMRENTIKKKETQGYPGGIGDIARGELNPEIRNQAKFLFSGIWLMTKNLRQTLINKILNRSVYIEEKKFNLYKTGFTNLKNYDSNPNNKPSWNISLNSFKKIDELSRKIGAKLILVYIPSRNIIYYERATKSTIPKKVLSESKFLGEFAETNKIVYINPINKLKQYVNNLPDDFSMKTLPYLEIDGHMNKVGYKIISDEIIKTLNYEK